MKVLLRADASVAQGTGHVMRCLTLGNALASAGHEVHLATSDSNIPWLENLINASGVTRHAVPANSLEDSLILEVAPDWLVVDSYEIPAASIDAIQKRVLTLAIVDGESRSINADIYLDHNVGAEIRNWSPDVASRLLAGSRFALVRQPIINVKRHVPWLLTNHAPRVLGVMGGSDPTGMIVEVARAVATTTRPMAATLICAPQWQATVDEYLSGHDGVRVIEPTSELHVLLANTDIAISAAGTSSWELCTLGLPSILIEVVENQTESLAAMTEKELVIGISSASHGREGTSDAIKLNLERLIDDENLRRSLSEHCVTAFDGLGASRVVAEMERVYGGESVRGLGSSL